MTHPTEDFVRRAVASLLRGEYAGKVVCSPCLITLTHQQMDRGWRKSEIERSMGEVFKSPGALTCMLALPCAICAKTRPCLGDHRR
jgi:hypothetical protein